MSIKEIGTSRELARLINAVLRHPKATPAICDGIRDILSQAHGHADPYDSPAGIELYVDAHIRHEQFRQQAVQGAVR